MRRAFFALALLLLPTAPVLADERGNCGTVDALEITSLTRTKMTGFLRLTLPDAPQAGRQIYAGEVAVANTPLALGPAITAMVQPSPGGYAAVLLVDLELAKIPQALLSRVHPAALDVTLNGSLAAAGGAPTSVCAAGVLRIGTADVRASGPMGAALAGFSGARFTGMTLTEVQGKATATLFNPLSFPIDIKDLDYAVWVGDRKIAEGERHGLRLHPGRENPVELTISASSVDVLAAMSGAMAGSGRVSGRLVAHVSVRVGKDQVLTVPLDLPGSIEVSR